MNRKLKQLIRVAPLVSLLYAGPVLATIPYTPVMLPPGAFPAVGKGVIDPALVFGKEYSHDIDLNIAPIPDPEQVIAWDGIGGVLDGVDFSGTRGPNFPREQEVDALGNSGDALYTELLQFTPRGVIYPDRAHLIFSIDDTVARYIATPTAGRILEKPSTIPLIPFSGPVLLTNGNVIGGSGDISVEESGAFNGFAIQHVWAPAPRVNGMPVPRDVDGLEVWGPEPGVTADSDKYSLDVDVLGGAGASVFSYDLAATSVPYISHAAVVSAVEALLGPVPTTAMDSHGDNLIWREAVNLDALMVRDIVGTNMRFESESDPAGNAGISDSIIFSIRQMPDPADPDGYYATGSEIFWMTASGGSGFLFHGGHLWDHAYALSDLGLAGLGPNERAYIDINALEAIGEVVIPEPSTYVLLGLGAVAALAWRRRAVRMA